MLAAVPRFPATLIPEPGQLPLGDQAWLDSFLSLPEGAARGYRNVVTGEALSAVEHRGKPVLFLARIFESAPVALLEAVSES